MQLWMQVVLLVEGCCLALVGTVEAIMVCLIVILGRVLVNHLLMFNVLLVVVHHFLHALTLTSLHHWHAWLLASVVTHDARAAEWALFRSVTSILHKWLEWLILAHRIGISMLPQVLL